MSSLALMRWLEASPRRYDTGMRWLTLGRLAPLHAAAAEAAVPAPGAQVLEIGCGTGAVTARLAARGGHVTALDHDPAMLEIARERLSRADAGAQPRDPASPGVEWLEQTAAEIDGLPEAGFDAVVASLCLSDMSEPERRYVLRHAGRRLRPGGRVVVADEVRSGGPLRRTAQRVWRLPQALLGWLLVGSVSSPLADLPGELEQAGLRVVQQRHWLWGSLALVVGERPT